MASFEEVNPRVHKNRSLSNWLYDWWRRLRIGVNALMLFAYCLTLHLAGVLETYAQVWYGKSVNPDILLYFDQADMKMVILKTAFFVVISLLFAAGLFYLPSGKVDKPSTR